MPYPIILAHGACRFDAHLNTAFHLDNSETDALHYFKRIRSTLRDAGHVVYHGHTEWIASTSVRARSLRQTVREVLDRSGSERVNIIAHSMGGLDARQMLLDNREEGLHERVACLVTIGTPHHGSSVADLAVERAGMALGLLLRLGLDVGGVRDLTRARCRAFNEQAASFEERCGVSFRSYAGSQPLQRIFLPLKLSSLYLHGEEGENDGLVAVDSARWSDAYYQGVVDADHLNEVGWGDPDDDLFGEPAPRLEARIRDLYLRIAADLPG
jgi:triacylglycerol lipase